jgi:hypothetical protein
VAVRAVVAGPTVILSICVFSAHRNNTHDKVLDFLFKKLKFMCLFCCVIKSAHQKYFGLQNIAVRALPCVTTKNTHWSNFCKIDLDDLVLS